VGNELKFKEVIVGGNISDGVGAIVLVMIGVSLRIFPETNVLAETDTPVFALTSGVRERRV
jgi:hypothetical protein